jgi:NADPH:quinone reductase-like Zn-dependent oxidoreductase
MMALTSPQTIRNSGRQQVEESYRKYVVPRFKDATVRWSEFQLQVTDETGNRGWDVLGHAEGAETFAFFITIMKEKGTYVVVTLGRHNQDDQTP